MVPRIILPRSPCPELVPERIRKAGSQRDDRSDVEVEIWPAVEAAADTGRKRVVDRRMSERTSSPDALDPIVGDLADDADHRIHFQEAARHSRIVDIELSGHQRLDHRRR